MGISIQEQNKATVLEAFDTLFNRRDYEAAERYWSPNYIQHSVHIEPGRCLHRVAGKRWRRILANVASRKTPGLLYP
jgi:hypothetical protein